MFYATFLGHQGWLLATEDTQILVDPLLEPGTGDIDSYWMLVYPPRRFDYSALGPVDAVLITHEHTDHFHVPSLLRLDRRIRIIVSSMMSTAARRVLDDLGFTVQSLAPGEKLSVGSLELHGLHPSGRTTPHELDVIPFVVTDRDRQGSFFSSVDLSLTREMAQEARQIVPRPGIWTHCCNDVDMSPIYTWMRHEADQCDARARDWADTLAQCFREGGPPELVLVYGGGFSFEGALEPLNARIFNCDADRATQALAKRLPAFRCRTALPGETIVLSNGRVTDVRESRGFVTALEKSLWPVHGTHASPVPLLPPSTGRRCLTASEHAELPRLLDELARFLYAGPLFTALFGIGPRDVGTRKPHMALFLRDDAGDLVFAYDTSACTFVKDDATKDAETDYVAGIECWSTDLFELLAVQRSPGYVVFGHMRFWNAIPSKLRIALDMPFYLFCHPLRHPDAFYRLYRAQATNAPPEQERIVARI